MASVKSGGSSGASSVRLNNRRPEATQGYHKNCFASDSLSGSKEFLAKLDARLRDLGDAKKASKDKKRTSLDNRPLFITTVKTGIFLDPPPDVAALLGLRNSSTSSNSSGQDSSVVMYSYSSQPRVINNLAKKSQNSRPRAKRDTNNNNSNSNSTTSLNKKNKDENAPLPYGNIMFDRRVVRGPAFVQHPVPTNGIESQASREAEARRRAIARRKAQKARILKLRVGTPPPVQGRKHEPIQTETYLEELYDHPIEKIAATQTDLQLDRPKTPPFVPVKAGLDVSTQIYPGELFNFDEEVRPMLEVLVGKTLEQAMVEVMEEEELAAIREQQRKFREERDAEKAEQLRLEQQQIRHRQEMEQRLQEQEDAVQAQKEVADRVAAAAIATGYVEGLLPAVLTGLRDSGKLPQPIDQDVEVRFMSWLTEEVEKELTKTIEQEDFIAGLVTTVLRSRGAHYIELGRRGPPVDQEVEPEEEEEEQEAEAEEEEIEPEPEPSMEIKSQSTGS